ncbi:hypoxanthine-guanine phosphoribosyltransferase [Vulcaniibacterium gelatinicum]|uniref:hypoxanthine-guanine phosphoribosyltransferase n=1 Tax=Vulcaniibacterium gelatinicum TaxID=2598725 RepID=UPI0011C76B32|nr:hypoxanthine-guanine phosphoribosyltransferase [Vulcaniibacterium gelatinicum]
MSDLARALAHAELVHDRTAIMQAIARMADTIRNDYAGSRPVYLTIMHGGMLFAGQLALELGARGLDLEFDYLHATRYRGDTSGGALLWKHRPATPLRGRRVLITDDILDEGHTLAAVRDWCRSEGAAEVRIATLVVKRHERCVPGLHADYVGLEVPDRYVFGFGMDYHEQGRNLPQIYALKE